ncbi:MAG: hypothetical protein QOE54_1028, partial [Streptosporangiaceae bacterium]|nr:hypothetical protein [Streptosporangiaceae bacterium]
GADLIGQARTARSTGPRKPLLRRTKVKS